jgi:M6 family metalloprotease-like protein
MILFFLAAVSTAAGKGLLYGRKHEAEGKSGENTIIHRCLHSELPQTRFLPLQRKSRWSLPASALAPDFDTTIHCLVLRYNFKFEDPDNPGSTGRGHFNLAPHPLPNDFNDATPQDSIDYLNRVGHFIDPPPHDSIYFDRQMRALHTYWNFVSEGKISLTWDIFPAGKDSAYELPHEMAYYGRDDIDDVVLGLESFFVDCIKLADTAHLIGLGPDIDFSQYQAIFLFHAGADRQNDIGFPPTPNDLFTGYIKIGDSVINANNGLMVDNGTVPIRDATMMPETANQDNRSTALNAVMAHEFGHQLGLVDLYSSLTFISQLGDFALMDDNGFGSGVDFGWPAGQSFGTVPVYPCAWSRAYLGFEPVVDFRQGQDIRVVAAEVLTEGIQLARVPISETEYYLIENRNVDIDGVPAGAQFDTLTNVILGPARLQVIGMDTVILQNGEYDFLCPGSGLLIYLVDEEVAALDWDGDGLNNFLDNDLQWNKDHRFIRLIEADGLVNFGGNYRSGYGTPEDMFRDDRATTFTPNTNPPAIDNAGGNTHVYITNISRAPDTTRPKQPLMDSVITFDLETDRLVANFPVRAGIPTLGMSPIADDLDGDGTDEIIVASDNLLSVFTTAGENFLQLIDPCASCEPYLDTMITSINRRSSFQPLKGYPVPLYFEAPQPITANPVTGDFAGDTTYVIVAYPRDAELLEGEVLILNASDVNDDGEADILNGFQTQGLPIALSFGDVLYAMSVDTSTDSAYIYRQDSKDTPPVFPDFELGDEIYHGYCRIGDRFVVLSGDDSQVEPNPRSFIHVMSDTVHTFELAGAFSSGPVTVDINRDGTPEVVAFTADGEGIYVSVDTVGAEPSFSVLARKKTGLPITVNPSAGDIDLDGRPDISSAGSNAVYAFSEILNLKTDFPIQVDDRHLGVDVISSVVVSDIQRGGLPELIYSNNAGNVYAHGEDLTYGFPLSSGDQRRPFSSGAAVVFADSTGGKLGYLGGDGWFYAWEIDEDTETDFWPMNGASPAGDFTFRQDKLGSEKMFAERLPDNRFFNYPNPVTEGQTTIRYFLGEEARKVRLQIYDLTGERVATMDGPTTGMLDNEVVWDCRGLTAGVYRCVIEVDFAGEKKTAFTDIAVIR